MNAISRSIFDRYIGIDYSGAETPTSSLKGLRVYLADHESLPEEVQPPPSPRKYWTRRGIAEGKTRGSGLQLCKMKTLYRLRDHWDGVDLLTNCRI